ncbi:MAG: lipoprotein signal peptidase [Flammeovirgaceae bacterium]|nr:lipoprotein signal peptidase [Flammeovirgaceae bacterium]
MKYAKYFLIVLAVIAIDQTSKLLVHKYMYLHEEINVMGEWFKLHYLLNPGMAFGIRWENEFGKLALTFFRIGAMIGIGYYLVRSIRKNYHVGFLLCLSLILGGAVGNVIDSTFYGVLLDNSLPESVSPWFHGQVIDMLFFPIMDFFWPTWVPLIGGDYFLFFSPVFNIADSSIFIGVAFILILQKRFFKEDKMESPVGSSTTVQMNNQQIDTIAQSTMGEEGRETGPSSSVSIEQP